MTENPMVLWRHRLTKDAANVNGTDGHAIMPGEVLHDSLDGLLALLRIDGSNRKWSIAMVTCDKSKVRDGPGLNHGWYMAIEEIPVGHGYFPLEKAKKMHSKYLA